MVVTIVRLCLPPLDEDLCIKREGNCSNLLKARLNIKNFIVIVNIGQIYGFIILQSLSQFWWINCWPPSHLYKQLILKSMQWLCNQRIIHWIFGASCTILGKHENDKKSKQVTVFSQCSVKSLLRWSRYDETRI